MGGVYCDAHVQQINFIFGGSLPSDPEMEWLDFEKNRLWLRKGVGVPKLPPNDENSRKFFWAVITAKPWEIDM